MVGVSVTAVLMAVIMLSSTRLHGPAPTITRVLLVTCLAIVASVAAWMLVNTVLPMPDSTTAVTLLSVELLALTVFVGARGRDSALSTGS